MADQFIDLQLLGFNELRQAVGEAPRETFTFLKQDFRRFGNRFVRRFKKERLHGRPGINALKMARRQDRNARAVVTGNSLGTLQVAGKLSRFLSAHERGATIRPKAGGYLSLSRKTGVKGQGKIFARRRVVQLPARLGFVTMFKAQAEADLKARVPGTVQRALKVAFERRLKRVAVSLSQLGRAVS